MDKMINRIISLIFVLALLGEGFSCQLHTPEVITISDANPIQFWLNGVETYNQKALCGMTPVCFCQQFLAGDIVTIQFTGDSGILAYDLGIYNYTGVEIGRESFVEYPNDSFIVSFELEDYGQDIQFKIESLSLSSWLGASSANSNTWDAITYGNGLYVAVSVTGSGNRVMTSPDGITWTARSSAANNNWFGVTYGNGLFVAVANSGTGNRVMTSPDGITWTIRTSAADNNWLDVTYAAGLFVAVANSGSTNQVMTSPDGINWTIRVTPGSIQWWDIEYGNGIFVVIGDSGTGHRAMTSPDGITWTLQSTAADLLWTSMTFGEGLFVAAETNGTGKMMTSPDGVTWTVRSTPRTSASWTDIKYGGGLFVAVSNGDGNVVVSNDGINWIAMPDLFHSPAYGWACIAYGTKFVAISAGTVMYSSVSDIIQASSDCISLTDNPDQCSTLITYANSNSFAGIDYSDASPSVSFQIRIPACFNEESFPDISESLDLSDSEIIQLMAEVKHKKLLDIGFMPFYMHKKLILILSHDSVVIDDMNWAKLDGYSMTQGRKTYPLRKAQALLTDKDFVQRNVL